MINEMKVNLELNRVKVCDLMIACTGICFGMEDELRDPNTSETRREILKRSIAKWEALHDDLEAQLKAFDQAQGY